MTKKIVELHENNDLIAKKNINENSENVFVPIEQLNKDEKILGENEMTKNINEKTGMVFVPIDQLNKDEKTLEVTINGNTTVIPRGKAVVVSKAVEEVIIKSGLMN